MRSLYKGILIVIVFPICAYTVSAQQNSVAIGTSTANQNAVLLLVGNGKQGLIIPTTTDQTQISTSASETGMIVFNTQLKQVFFYDGGAWNAIGSGSGGSYSLSYNATTKVITLVSGTSGTPTIDMSTTALAGDLGGTLGAPTVTRIQGSSISSTAPATLNQALIWDTGANAWTPTSISGDITPLTLGKFNVTGLLGAKLPLLSAAVAASSTNYLVYDAVGSKWNWSSGSAGGITSVANGGTGLGTTPTNGQLLVGNGTGYTLRTLLSSDIPNLSATQITSGILPLANGGTSISTVPTANQVLTTNAAGTVLWGSITGSHLSASGINYPATFTANNFATAGALTATTGTITTLNLSGALGVGSTPNYGTAAQVLTSAGAGAPPTWTTISGGGNMVSTNNLSDVANVATARTNLGLGSMALAANPMTTAGDIIYGGVSGALTRLPTGTGFLRGGATPSYSAVNLASTDVTGTLAIANGGTGATSASTALTNLGALGTSLASGKLFVGSAGNVATAQSLSGDATMTNAGALTIANSAIIDAKVSATAAIAGTKISPNFGAQNVVTTGALTAGSSGQFTVNATGNITKINNIVTSFPSAQGTANTVLTNDGSGNLTWGSTNAWGILGNTGTSAATNFIGTTDANDLVFKTNNTEYARLTSTGKFGIGNNGPNATLDVVNNSTNPGISVSKTGASGAGLQVIANGGAEGININQDGGGYALDVIVNNSSNSSSAIIASHTGPGTVFNANTTGTGGAASLSILNAASAATALTVSTTGTGPAATFSGGNVGIGVTAPTAKLQVENGTNAPGAGNGNVEIFTANATGSALYANFSTGGDGTGTVYSQGSVSGYENNATGTNNFGLWGHQFGNGSGGWGVLASNGASTTSPTTYAGLAGVSYSGIFMGGNVGIGTTTPAASNQLDVQASYGGAGNAINAQNNSTGNALYAYAVNGGNGVWGYSPTGIGVEGQSVSSNGVYGFSSSGTGVFGSTTSGYAGIFLGGNVGIGTSTPLGSLHVNKTDWNLTPVILNSTNTSAGSTLRFMNPATGNHTYDIIGSTGTGAALAVGSFGIWDNTSGAYRFSIGPTGAVSIPGTLSKGSGTFKIDHPVDPENKFLYHSFVESPDMMNVYNGNITTDEKGNAIVHLPDYFESLNKDFRYQLTVIGEFAQAIVGKKIQGNQFVIKTDKPNIEVSWQVTGVRKDPFAEKNRVVPEVLKTPEEKGKYLHPDAYGMPPEKGIENKIHQ